ncbi:MAG: hypothetical protein J5I94_30750, partial [Phaeodactylibacter sp.]|nr:hypothetical protein [Phaeodactylibacter sp.]
MRRQPLLFRSTLWNVFTSVLLTAGALLCFGPQAAAQDYLITTAGGALVVTDNVGNSETLDVSENGANIRFNAAGRTYSLDGGPETAMPVDIALAGLTSITVDAAGGDDVIDIGAFAAELPSLTINGGAGGDVVNFNGSITFADGANLNVDLQDDDANPGVDDLTFNSSVALQLQGSGAATIRVSRNIRMNFGAALRTADGDLTVEANQQAAPTTGEFMGLFLIGSTVEVAGAGNLTVKGKNGDAGSFSCGVCLIAGTTLKGGTAGSNTVVQGTGGASTGNFNHGVQLDGASNTITSSGGDVLVEGWGGGSGASSENIGVILRSGGQITAEGMGTVTVRGTGGTSTGNNQYGIRVDGANSTITSSGGEVLVEGWGGGSGASRNNFGVLLISGGQVAGVGMAAVTVRGTGGIGSSGFNYGLSIRGPITSSGGNVLLEGQGGGSGAFTQQNVGVVLDNNSQVMAGGAGTVTILGTGGNSGNGFDNFGIWMNGANSVVTSAGGDVFLEGIGGNVASGGQNIGISMIGEISAGGMGTVTVLGTAGPSGLNNIGIAIAGGGVITSSGGDVSVQGQGGGNDGLELNIGVSVGGTITAGGTGAVTVVGTGGSDVGFSNYGVYVAGPSGIITSSGGDVSVQGQGGSGTSFENHGVIVGEGGQISAGGDGAVAVNGTGGASTGNGNYGVALRGAASVITSSGGDVQVDGQGGGSGASFSNNGVHVDEGQISAGGAGTVTVNGTGGATTDDFNIGVEVRGATGAITSSGGDVLVNGQGGGSGASRSNIGISVGSDGGQITAGGMGSVTVLGVGGASTGNSNFGVSVGGAGAITSSGGDVLVDGQGGGSGASLFNPGIWVSGDGQITAGGIGAVTVLGAGGPSSGIVNHGVYIEAVNAIASSAGPISITGAKGAASTGAADIITTNGGSITSTSTTAGITFDSQDGGLWPNTDGLEVSTSAGQAAVFVAGSKLNIDIDGTTPNTQFQQLTLNGGIDLTGAELTFMGSSHSPAAGQSFLIVDNDGTDPVAGIFDGLPEASFIPNFLSSGLNAFITYRGGDGNDVVLSIFDGLPGDNCSNALDLGALSSPFSGTTAGFNDDTDVSCLNASLDRIFYIDVPAGFELTIGQTSNTYNSQHRVAYGGACPGDTQIDCIDDPDTQATTWANTTGADQRVWWVQEGSSDGDVGDFTLAWELALAGANVTFCVDIGCLPPPTSVSVAGDFNGFDPSANPMTDPDGDGVYCTTVLLPAGDQEYIFLIDGVEEQLQAGSSCTVTDAGVTNRALTVVAGVAQSVTFLFGSCDASLSIPNITFPDIPLSCVGDETVTVTGGATPAGGVYSGPGVTDNGDGTFDVDLSVLDEGDYTLTYTLPLALQCTASETATLSVDKDTRAPDIVFPSQDVVATLAPCDIGGTAMVSFDVSVTDDCGGSYIPGDVVVPGSEFTVKVISGPSLPAISSAGGNSFSGAFGPGTYQVQASAEDAAGNPRNEDFLVIVTQDAPPPTDLICDYNVVVRLDDDCERTITPSLVLEGDFGCLTNDDFVVSIVDGQGQSVGNTLDGAGSYIYEVSLAPGVGPVSGFEPCWGYIAGEDKTAPDIDCPDDTDEGALVLECFTESGTLDASDLSMEPLNFSCFIDGGSSGSSIDPGVHYYDLIPFQVDRTDYYTILVSDEFSSIYDET